MKRWIIGIAFLTALAILYVDLQVKTISAMYRLHKLYRQRDKLLCQREYYLAKILEVSSPSEMQERLLARQVPLTYAIPTKVVSLRCGSTSKVRKTNLWSRVFGMPQAVADE